MLTRPASTEFPAAAELIPTLDRVKTVKVSIIIPVYNESLHLPKVIERVLEASMPQGVEKELIVVDDGSTDGTSEFLHGLKSAVVKVHHSMLNFGKGTAIRIGLKHATGDILVVQDGDHEYNPQELAPLIQPILDGKAAVVYGSRFRGRIQGMLFRYWLANKLLVWTVRFLYGSRITDEATAYKAFRRDVLMAIPLRCRRFEFCPEVTSKILRKGIAIAEIPISYSPRSKEQGKKIRFRDAVEAFWTLLRYRFLP